MKKVFLLFGIAAFSSASAQQNDLFDIQKHLQKKNVEDKKSVEKNNITLPLNRPKTYSNIYLGNKPENYYTLPNGDKVVTISGYNMPCVQPDMLQFQTMPNIANNSPFNFNYSPNRIQPGQIPNGSNPFRFIVSR